MKVNQIKRPVLRIIKNILKGLFVPCMVIIGMFIHDFSHAFFVLITGNDFYGISFVSNGSLHCYHNIVDDLGERLLIIAGGSVGLLACLAIPLFISIKKNYIVFLNGFVFSIFSDLFNWFISPIIQYGDCYNFFSLLGWSLSNTIIFVSIPLFVVLILILRYIIKKDKCVWTYLE